MFGRPIARLSGSLFFCRLLVCLVVGLGTGPNAVGPRTVSGQSADYQRTVVFIYAPTVVGQNVFIRGGISAGARPGCSAPALSDPCAVPIRHRVIPTDTGSAYRQWSAGDLHLDWYGAQAGQSNFSGTVPGGTPLMWTTSLDPTGPTIENDGRGYTSINRFGPHYWLLDVDMDCSQTQQGWFEFKSYITPTVGWERDISQYSYCAGLPSLARPYVTNNHIGRCGQMNVYYNNNNDCNIYPVPTSITPPTAGCGQIRMFPDFADQSQDDVPKSVQSSYVLQILKNLRSPSNVGPLPAQGQGQGHHPTDRQDPGPRPAARKGSILHPAARDGHPLDPHGNHNMLKPAGGAEIRAAEQPEVRALNGSLFGPDPFIVNGKPSSLGRWPWQGIHEYSGTIGGCACVLIDRLWAVTAAHCVRGTNPAIMRLHFGQQNLLADQGNEQAVRVSNIYIHELYGNGVNDNDYDIALMRLMTPADVTSSYVVNTVCLPRGYGTDDFDNNMCWASGFGSTLGTSDANRLTEINVPVLTVLDCLIAWGINSISVRQVCMGDGNKSACGGDSGGPLVCWKDGRWVLVGITSWGPSSCQGKPAVYTRMTEFITWIDRIVNSVAGVAHHIPE